MVIVYVVIFIIVVIYLLYNSSNNSKPINEIEEYPTIHSECSNRSTCGGDLVCDSSCNKCRKPLGSTCAADVDCEKGLMCKNWVCSKNNKSDKSVKFKHE